MGIRNWFSRGRAGGGEEKWPHIEEDCFLKVLRAEHEAISARRGKGAEVKRIAGDQGNGTGSERECIYDTTGVCLSGGGIRSAAFCLGALQSLAVRVGIERIDYLSTVSGGGYIGSSVSAGMTRATRFPFAAPREYRDPESVGHLRDYLNYLLPRGHRYSFVDAIAVILRGILTNLIFVTTAIFLASGITLLAYPTNQSLVKGSFAVRLYVALAFPWSHVAESAVPECSFGLTLVVLGTLAAFLGGWAIWRSSALAKGGDIRGPGIRWTRFLLTALLLMAFLDLQPLAIKGLLWLQSGHWLSQLEYLLAGSSTAAAAVAAFADRLAAFLKTSSGSSRLRTTFLRFSAFLGIWVSALVLPLLIWFAYLWLCTLGIDQLSNVSAAATHQITSAAHRVVEANFVNRLSASVFGLAWLIGKMQSMPLVWVYLDAGLALALLTLLFGPNANSLHRIYRDKLSKAFLFDPSPLMREPAGPDAGDLEPLDSLKLSELRKTCNGPYQLINAALNLQRSKHANRRGRNADFFLFSPQFVGSDATDYVDTTIMEKQDSHLDLATAMAISGAAVSSNMGSQSIRPLTPTLALLNFRLGYWLPNPRFVMPRNPIVQAFRMVGRVAAKFWVGKKPVAPMSIGDGPGRLQNELRNTWKGLIRQILGSSKLYLVSEMLGNLDETHPLVYVTDGGHIENLGLYQLLKRRCRVIIAIDAEADPKLEFRALSTVERYARIDLGIRIDLPWQDICTVSKAVSAKIGSGEPVQSRNGPHCAVGIINYPNEQIGYLVYVKASLSGDESDYILNYKGRYPAFPYEATSDQFFSEEQFEVYRALGFHASECFFEEGEDFSWRPNPAWGAGPAQQAAEVREIVLRAIRRGNFASEPLQ